MKEIKREDTFGPACDIETVWTRRLVRIEGLVEGTVQCVHTRDSNEGTLCVRTFMHYERSGQVVKGGCYMDGSLSLFVA